CSPSRASTCQASRTPASCLSCSPPSFFQAEDGIRGFHVTGVQTCALPISTSCERSEKSESSVAWAYLFQGQINWQSSQPKIRLRSEERRVGEECRAR